MKLKPILFVLTGLAAGVLLGAIGVLSLHRTAITTTMSISNQKQLTQSMMGTENANSLPLKKASDVKASLSPTIAADGTKEFTLDAEPIRWQYANGKSVLAWGYNGQIPGPEIRVTEGDKVRITFTNRLPKATTIHWHGLDVPNSQDGVPGVTQTAVQPGKSFTYEFIAGPAGTHFYHAHGSGNGDEAQQLDMGLSGAFMVEPKDYQKPDKEFTLLLGEWQTMGNSNFNMAMQSMDTNNMNASMGYNLFTINGLAYPDTQPLVVKQGDKVRIRLINVGASTSHPMHLHGHQFTVVAEDGNELTPAQQFQRSTITVNPGETYDILVDANNPGVWAFHCHELHHADAGLMTLFKYDGYTAPASNSSNGNSTNNSMPGMNM
jgi:FtsP/CotA-like multicopper oxidase with cupredoxin domain